MHEKSKICQPTKSSSVKQKMATKSARILSGGSAAGSRIMKTNLSHDELDTQKIYKIADTKLAFAGLAGVEFTLDEKIPLGLHKLYKIQFTQNNLETVVKIVIIENEKDVYRAVFRLLTDRRILTLKDMSAAECNGVLGK
jgi:hypothetical protein